jgi:hypothetical protein
MWILSIIIGVEGDKGFILETFSLVSFMLFTNYFSSPLSCPPSHPWVRGQHTNVALPIFFSSVPAYWWSVPLSLYVVLVWTRLVMTLCVQQYVRDGGASVPGVIADRFEVDAKEGVMLAWSVSASANLLAMSADLVVVSVIAIT